MRALGGATGVLLIAAALFLLWPVQLGGWTSYAIIDDSSMEPRFRSGDLVVTRARDAYRVGDTVLYGSERLDTHAFQRIVAVDNGRFTFRGDNRTASDPEVLTDPDIVGVGWFSLEGIGRPLRWLGDPVHLGIVSFIAALLVLGAGREIARRRRGRGVVPTPVAAEGEPRLGFPAIQTAARGLLVAGCIASFVFALLATVAWRHDDSRERTVVGAYAHSGAFSYGGKANRSVAYPDGVVATGQPAFVRLMRGLDFAFDYRFSSKETANIRGGIALDAVVSDGQDWTRTIPISSSAPFEGTIAHVEGRLGLQRVATMITRLQEATGTNITEATVSIVPRITVVGYTGDKTIDEDFTPALPFTLDSVALRLIRPEAAGTPPDLEGKGSGAGSPLTPRSAGTTIVTEPASLALGSLVALDVERARSLGLLGLLVGLTCAFAGGLLIVRRAPGGEVDQIDARYGSRIVHARATIPEGRWVTEVHDIESLVRLAETYDRVVLRVVEPDGSDAFLVDDGIAVYRYRPTGGGPLGTPRAMPVHFTST